MLTDPQAITIAGVTSSLPRVNTRDSEAVYSNEPSTIQFRVSHQKGKRIRRSFRLDLKKVSADVFLPSQNVTQSMSCYIVFDMPVAGYTVEEAIYAYTGLIVQLGADGNEVLTAFLGGQS